MKITKIRTGLLTIGLKKPFKTALRTANSLTTVIVAIDTDAGVTGYGEGSPSGSVTGDSLGGIQGAIREYFAPRLMGKPIENLEENLCLLDAACIGNSNAKAACDIALHDLYGKLHQIPLYKLFGGFRKDFQTDLTISVNDPEEMVADSLSAVQQGFSVIKLKVGKDPELDIRRIRSIREAVGAGIVIRVDANQGWTPKEAVSILRKLDQAGLGIELVEQPVPALDLEGLKMVTDSSPIPVMADESVHSVRDAIGIVTAKAADFVNIKLMKCGGLHGALRICAVAEAYKMECMLGCMLESKLSVTAAGHLAGGKSIVTRFDLDGPSLCSSDPIEGGLVINGPKLTLPDAPGLGISGVQGVRWE
ncbi:MAG: dipeptide epimerase [Candidatus Wallbacteria bacterium]|nr:dipeptide epimerase [Candidatus Wallbacteria bacterium]